MQGMILAAGMGKRLKELTQNNTKCMVKVNGETLISRALSQLQELGITRVIIVVGYESKKLIEYISTLNLTIPIEYVENPIFDKTNNIYSLWLARNYLLEQDTLLLESDIIFEKAVLQSLLDDSRPTLALVDHYESWMDGTVLRINENDEIIDFVPGKKFDFSNRDQFYKTVNIYKFSKEFSRSHYVPFLEAYSKALGNNEYYEQVLRVITMLDDPEIYAKRLNGQVWYEIDDIQDLDIASSLFAEDDERLTMLQQRYGGYWRYPKLLDFCYLVNPYYPPQKLTNEMKASFDTLLTQYPSGMRVNSLLAAKLFGLNPENIVIGNGAAELIKILMEETTGKVGVIKPTFEEYPNRLNAEQIVTFISQNDDFRYTAKDLIDYFGANKVETLLLINPDNPSGNALSQKEVDSLVEWCEQVGTKLVLDESFADFADEPFTLLSSSFLKHHPSVSVVKSISKSYGVPGVRLGVLASGDSACIERIKQKVSIWNINSFGEFYLQIAEKYKKDYVASLKKLCKERTRFVSRLTQIRGIRVLPSQANFLMIELTCGKSSRSVAKELLSKKNLFVKDLSSKIKNGKQYLRLSVRTTEENDLLVEALQSCLSKE